MISRDEIILEYMERLPYAPYPVQEEAMYAWAACEDGLLLSTPTGTGKTLAAFLWCLNRIMFSPTPEELQRCRILYISPIKARIYRRGCTGSAGTPIAAAARSKTIPERLCWVTNPDRSTPPSS